MKKDSLPCTDVTRSHDGFARSAVQTSQIITLVAGCLNHFTELNDNDVGQHVSVLYNKNCLAFIHVRKRNIV